MLRKLLCKRVLFSIIFVLSLSQGLFSEESMSNVYGKIIDAVTKEPVKGVQVYINVLDEYDRSISTRTDASGEFSFKQFPANSYEYEIAIEINSGSRGDDLDGRYFNQLHTASFILPKGKNLFLKPIELQPGVRVNGQLMLPEGNSATVGRVIFLLANPQESDSKYTHWTSVSPISDGSFLSQLLPVERDLIMVVNTLSKDGTGYVGTRRNFRLAKGSTAESIAITIPDTQTEIKGLVVNRQGIPLANQVVGIYDDCGLSVVTDENGRFCIRSIPAGTTEVYARYRGISYKTHFISNLPVNSGETIFLRITADEGNFFTYLITRSPYGANSN
ncbi:MAG: hypothetical protein GY757_02125 [bacterium]|nr:hypothetical protein [bacterium]